MDFPIDITRIVALMLAFVRIGALFLTLPIFGDNPTPVRTRIFLSLALTMILGPIIHSGPDVAALNDVVGLVMLILKEAVFGLILGFIGRLVFDGIVFAASLVGYQMGFGTATLLFPDAEMQMSSFTALHRIVAMLIFLSLNLHHIFIRAVSDSFQLLPVGSALPSNAVGESLITLTASLFSIGLQLAAPVLISLLFTMAALGLIARTVPQLNVFVISFPASFFVGLIIYIAALPFFPSWMQGKFQETESSLTMTMQRFSH